jgi:hypothetical protein
MVANAQITGAPVISYHGVLGKQYVWKIEMPLMISYINADKTINQPMKVTIIVMRVPVQDNRYQIAINEFLPEVENE